MIRLLVATLILFSSTPPKAECCGNHFFKKTITITINISGQAIIGRDTLASDQLTDELQKRLWKSYLGTGEMYDAIHLEFNGEVSAVIKENIKKAIGEGQQKALTDVCLQKHKKLFEDLNNRQQKKIRDQFPVLFQQDY